MGAKEIMQRSHDHEEPVLRPECYLWRLLLFTSLLVFLLYVGMHWPAG